MRHVCTVTLRNDGAFSMEAPEGEHVLMYDAEDMAWNLVGPALPGSAVGRLLARSPTLDFGLTLLVGIGGKLGSFGVELPCGNMFSRPGKMPALDVLAAFGYAPVKAVTGFVLVDLDPSLQELEVRRKLVSSLSGSSCDLGSVEATEISSESTLWCCEVSLPLEGVVHLGSLDELVAEALAPTGCVPFGRAEAEGLAGAPSPGGVVVRFGRSETVAA